jgi:hypothetical protein
MSNSNEGTLRRGAPLALGLALVPAALLGFTLLLAGAGWVVLMTGFSIICHF